MTKYCEDCKYYTHGEPCRSPRNTRWGASRMGQHWLTYEYAHGCFWPFDILMHTCGWRARWFKPK